MLDEKALDEGRLRRHPRGRQGSDGAAAAGHGSPTRRQGAATDAVALVGKGITFDTGGVSHQAGRRACGR